MIGDIANGVKTHGGSVKMQKFVDKCSFNDLNIIVEEIKDDFASIMTEKYGNYFCQ